MTSPAARHRLTSGFAGFAAALAVCLLVVAVMLLLTPRRNVDSVPVIDYSVDLVHLRQAAPYQVYAPVGLPARWRPTSSRFTRDAAVTWHLGFATPADQYAALEESNEPPAAFIARMTSNGVADGTQEVNGVVWERRYRKDKHQRSLVRTAGGVTLVVTGSAGYEELGQLAAALRSQPRLPAPAD